MTTSNNAPNLDCETYEELFRIWASADRNPRITAREWFPDRPKGYVSATRDFGRYAINRAVAIDLRSRGDIRGASGYEAICESIYQRIPEWARW